MRSTFTALLFTTALVAPGCGDDSGTPTPDGPVTPDDTAAATCEVTPGAWSAPNFAANAADALALRAQLDLLTGNPNMRGVETGAVDIDLDDSGTVDAGEIAALKTRLLEVYLGGNPGLAAQAHPNMNAMVIDAIDEFAKAAAVGPTDLVVTTWTPGTDGGLFEPVCTTDPCAAGTSPRRAAFNPGGIELRQVVDKGLFAGGGLYRYAISLTQGPIDEATIDKIAAAWGSNDTLDPLVSKTDSANYSFSMGFHGTIATQLTAAKAYAADANCTTERDAALVAVFRNWEQSMIARHVHYTSAGSEGLANAGADDLVGDKNRAAALHEFAEGLGLAIGFHGMPNPTSGPLTTGRTITDADIEAILTSLGVNRTNLAASTVGNFVADTSAFSTAQIAAETRIKTVYGISDADILAYRAAITPN
jgi:hypothetical protein